LLPYPNYTSQ
jgi:hypothetical protein